MKSLTVFTEDYNNDKFFESLSVINETFLDDVKRYGISTALSNKFKNWTKQFKNWIWGTTNNKKDFAGVSSKYNYGNTIVNYIDDNFSNKECKTQGFSGITSELIKFVERTGPDDLKKTGLYKTYKFITNTKYKKLAPKDNGYTQTAISIWQNDTVIDPILSVTYSISACKDTKFDGYIRIYVIEPNSKYLDKNLSIDLENYLSVDAAIRLIKETYKSTAGDQEYAKQQFKGFIVYDNNPAYKLCEKNKNFKPIKLQNYIIYDTVISKETK